MIDYSQLIQQPAAPAQPSGGYRKIANIFDAKEGRMVTGPLDPNRSYIIGTEMGGTPETEKQVQDALAVMADRDRMLQSGEAADIRDTSLGGLRRAGYTGRIDIALNTDEQYKADYELGKTALLNKYLESTKLANKLMPGSPEYSSMHGIASAELQAGMAKLNAKKDSWENKIEIVNRDPKLSPQLRMELLSKAYGQDPVYKYKPAPVPEALGAPLETAQGFIQRMRNPETGEVYTQPLTSPTGEPIMKPPAAQKPLIPEIKVSQFLGQLATDNVNIRDAQTAQMYAAAELGVDWATEYPEAVAIIAERAKDRKFSPLNLADPYISRKFSRKQGVATSIPLDRNTAQAILNEAGGDKETARQIAKQRGYKF